MSSPTPKPVSIVIEWENAKLSDLERAERMLAQLGRQMAEAARRRNLVAELLVLYDSDAVDPAVPRTAIERQIDAAAWPGTVQLVQACAAVLAYRRRRRQGVASAIDPASSRFGRAGIF